jgi:hypothetical protein
VRGGDGRDRPGQNLTEEALATGEGHGLEAAVNPQLPEDIVDVVLGGG